MFLGRKTRPLGIAISGAIERPKLVTNAKSIAFDGSDDIVKLSPSNTLVTGTNVTMSAWVKLSGTGKGYVFQILKSATSSNLSLQVNSSKTDSTVEAGFVGAVIWNGTGHSGMGGDSSLDDGNWHHLVLTTTSSAQVIYVDGVSAHTGTATFSNAASIDLAGIGDEVNSNYEFQGNIDEVAIWSRALKASEIEKIHQYKRMNLAESSVGYDSNNLEGWWRMGDGDTYPVVADRRKTFFTGKSIDFDGSDDYINCGNSFSYLDEPDANEFTIAVWVNGASGADGTIFSKADNSNRMVQLYAHTDDKLIAKAGGTTINGATVVIDGNWHHVALVVRNDGGTYKGQIYLNGSTDATEQNVGSTTATGMDFLIGARRDADNTDHGYLFTGKISDVAVWDAALDAATLTSVYNSGEPNDLTLAASYTAGSGVDKTGDLQGYWRMGNGTLDDGNIAGNGLIADQTNATLDTNLVTSFPGLSVITYNSGTGKWNYDDSGTGYMSTQTITAFGAGVYKIQFTLYDESVTDGQAQIFLGVRKVSDNGLITLQSSTALDTSASGTSHTYYGNVTESCDEFIIYAYTNQDDFFIDNITFQKVNGNAGVMTNMAAGDVVELAPNRHTGTMTNMASGDIETDVPS
jgi:hypothetical protein